MGREGGLINSQLREGLQRDLLLLVIVCNLGNVQGLPLRKSLGNFVGGEGGGSIDSQLREDLQRG